MEDTEQLKDEITAQFCEVVARKYRYHCSRHGEKATPEGLLMYALRAQVIRTRTVSHYMMMELYPKALYNSTGRIEAISKLSEKTGLAERTIRGLLNRPCRYTPGAM